MLGPEVRITLEDGLCHHSPPFSLLTGCTQLPAGTGGEIPACPCQTPGPEQPTPLPEQFLGLTIPSWPERSIWSGCASLILDTGK